MAYTKHHTQALILRSFDRGEYDRAYALLTREFGLIYAHAKSVRKEQSKLRGALQDFMYSEIVVVRARESWRITDARVELDTWSAVGDSTAKKQLIARLYSLVGKLIGVEDLQSSLFDTLAHGALFLSRTHLRSDELANLEVLLALRILRQLGYLGEDRSLEHLLATPFINDILVFEAGRLRTKALSQINRSMRSLPL